MQLTKEEIKDIIEDEVTVDCYNEYEAYTGWGCYMDDNMNFPFEAEYLVKKRSGEKVWKKLNVVRADEDNDVYNGGEYNVEIELDDIVISVNINKLKNAEADEMTMQALQVWRHK